MRAVAGIMNYKKLMWNYLISKGAVIKAHSIYGNEYDDKATKKIQRMWASGDTCVDWDKTSEVKDGLREKFEGTFHENPHVPTLEGTIVFDCGESQNFFLEIDEDMNFTDVVRAICEF